MRVVFPSTVTGCYEHVDRTPCLRLHLRLRPPAVTFWSVAMLTQGVLGASPQRQQGADTTAIPRTTRAPCAACEWVERPRVRRSPQQHRSRGGVAEPSEGLVNTSWSFVLTNRLARCVVECPRNMWYARGELELCIDCFRRALFWNPEQTATLYNLATILVEVRATAESALGLGGIGLLCVVRFIIVSLLYPVLGSDGSRARWRRRHEVLRLGARRDSGRLESGAGRGPSSQHPQGVRRRLLCPDAPADSCQCWRVCLTAWVDALSCACPCGVCARCSALRWHCKLRLGTPLANCGCWD